MSPIKPKPKESPEWEAWFERHLASARRAVQNLAQLRDNIDTEGERTFEDGMISCSAAQLGLMGLWNGGGEEAESYARAAAEMMDKHRCLQQALVPDCRVHGATLRFWEAQYDLLLDQNMLNSPHGWTSWKSYATWYLYLLTGEKRYLQETMDTLGACVQMVDENDGHLRWAFIVDPCVPAGIWEENPRCPGQGVRRPGVVGEGYREMISGWWKTADENPVGGYLSMPLVTQSGVVPCQNTGGCCDNDVHEHFKCLEEIALTRAYVVQDESGLESWNCTARLCGGVLVVKPYEPLVRAVHINTVGAQAVQVEFPEGAAEATVAGMEWIKR